MIDKFNSKRHFHILAIINEIRSSHKHINVQAITCLFVVYMQTEVSVHLDKCINIMQV